MKTDDAIDSMKALLDSDKYKNARKKINSWKERLKHANSAEVQVIEKE
jgi:hypothetical protein